MKIHYNAPVILTFTLAALAARLLGSMTDEATTYFFFTLQPDASLFNPMTWIRMFTHIIGHADWNHLLGNFSLILLIGPLLEEKYGSKSMAFMITTTAVVTALLHTFFFTGGLLGASGIVFMLILLGSFANIKQGHIPLTFILIVILYLGKEFIYSFSYDNISQFAHIIGGIVGSGFGFRGAKDTVKASTPNASY